MKYKFIGIPVFFIACVFIYAREGGSFAFLGIGKRHLPDIIVLGTSFYTLRDHIEKTSSEGP